MNKEEAFLQSFWEEHARWTEHRCSCGDPNAMPPCGHCVNCWVCYCDTCEEWHMNKPEEVLFCLEEQNLMDGGWG